MGRSRTRVAVLLRDSASWKLDSEKHYVPRRYGRRMLALAKVAFQNSCSAGLMAINALRPVFFSFFMLRVGKVYLVIGFSFWLLGEPKAASTWVLEPQTEMNQAGLAAAEASCGGFPKFGVPSWGSP